MKRPANSKKSKRPVKRARSVEPAGTPPPRRTINRPVRRTKRTVAPRRPLPRRTQENIRDSIGFLNDVYRTYYRNRSRLRQGDLNNSLYRFAGVGDTGYRANPVKEADVLKVVQDSDPLCKVFTQRGEPLQEGLRKGDYVYFDSKVKQDSGGEVNERRIVVNVKNQQAALNLAANLVKLFDPGQSDIAPYFRQFKVKLSTTADTGREKYDKLILYYGTDPKEKGNGDRVGSELAGFIEDTVPDADRSRSTGAFYSPVVKGVAWADEPDHIDAPKPRSFTESRVDALERVIQQNRYVDNPGAFRDLVYREFERSNIDWPPHRNIDPPEPPNT